MLGGALVGNALVGSALVGSALVRTTLVGSALVNKQMAQLMNEWRNRQTNGATKKEMAQPALRLCEIFPLVYPL